MGLKTTVKKSGSFLSFNFMAMSVGFFTEYWSCNRWHCVSARKTISFFRDPNGLFHQLTRLCHLLHNPYPMQNDHIDFSITRM